MHLDTQPNVVEEKPNFLVIQLARFGDLIQTKRLILSLQAQGQVELVVDQSLVSLAQLIYPQLTIHPLAAHGHHNPLQLHLVREQIGSLSAKNYHSIYNLNFSGLNFALATLFPQDRVQGYVLNHGQRQIDFWPQLLMRWTKDRRRAGLNLVDAWGLYARPSLDPSLVNPPAQGQGGGLGVVMAGQNARRSLPAKILAPLVLAAHHGRSNGPIYLLGAGHESRAAHELIHYLPPSLRSEIRNLVGQTTWAELFDLVGSLDLLLSPDTGTAHLAAHLGVPVLAFFLSSAWCPETGPYGLGHVVLQAMPPCAPCLEQAPCAHELLCRNVFAAPQVLAWVSGLKDKPLPAGLAAMVSGFDTLGLTYTAQWGQDPWAQERQAFRTLATGMAGLGYAGFLDPTWIQHWVEDRDWMLPQKRGWCYE